MALEWGIFDGQPWNVAVEPLLTPIFTLFNLSLIVLSTPS